MFSTTRFLFPLSTLLVFLAILSASFARNSATARLTLKYPSTGFIHDLLVHAILPSADCISITRAKWLQHLERMASLPLRLGKGTDCENAVLACAFVVASYVLCVPASPRFWELLLDNFLEYFKGNGRD
eukprot:TRINITY_DN10383_c0_g3_i2.p1 TRINITY_DN10383_c0_g3~~TRINITY_DN10383_c0_g3_i2.p1  ORF type:complete len:129 (-),score=5.49 TRINITY_DN10383_c0_g3_i2:372-758(-)